MLELTDETKLDRLPIIISGEGIFQFLSAAKLSFAIGQAQTVYNALDEWEITDKVIQMSFDTTSENTGKDKGACVLLQ